MGRRKRPIQRPVRAKWPARSGQSLQEFLLATLTDLASRPDVRTVLERTRERVRRAGVGLTSEQILDAIAADRR